MINDPLLMKAAGGPEWSPPSGPPAPDTSLRAPGVARAPRTGRKRRGAATSARILAVGISTSTMFALTAGYGAAAKKNLPDGPVGGTPVPQQTPQDQQPAGQQVVESQTPQQPATPSSRAKKKSGQQAAPQAQQPSSPKVVQIPVDTVAPAQPGNQGGNNQPSSGSN